MPPALEGLIGTAAQAGNVCERHVYGVVIAKVVNNADATGEGRVQIELSWLPGVRPWARLSRLDAGTYFVPQHGAEVLVAFNHGDIREPYVLGTLWNSQDRPPTEALTDPVTKRMIKTPVGHNIEFDDISQSIRITNSRGHAVRIGLDKIEIEAADASGENEMASITLDAAGKVSIEAARSIELKAPSISIKSTKLDVTSEASTDIKGGQACSIQAALVKIN
jgi:uncharacterized protein involved in type VI secretion and phage assembly